MNNDINKYYLSLIQEISTRQLSNEDGDNQEQTFTRYVFDVLSEAGETENATVAFDEKDLGTKKQHKINGYAIADNYETVDLFISIPHGVFEVKADANGSKNLAYKTLINSEQVLTRSDFAYCHFVLIGVNLYHICTSKGGSHGSTTFQQCATVFNSVQ